MKVKPMRMMETSNKSFPTIIKTPAKRPSTTLRRPQIAISRVMSSLLMTVGQECQTLS